MSKAIRRALVALPAAASVVFAAGSSRHPDWGFYPAGWPGFGYNAQHWGTPGHATQPLSRIKWSAPVDLVPTGGAHYGTPMVTPSNTVVFPVKTTSGGGFRIEGRRAADGVLVWSLNTGYITPNSGWVPPCGSTLLPSGGVAIPDSGGRVMVRASADAASSTTQEVVFYGAANYAANPSTYDSNVKINTPITCDQFGTMYFGFTAGTNPINLRSGIARITAAGQASWVSAATASGDSSITRVALNCAPAVGQNGTAIYIGVVDGNANGYLLCLDSTTLARRSRVRLSDPKIGGDAEITSLSTASPTIAPDGQVFYGVFDAGLNNNDRGWMLHFDGKLIQTLTPGAFGWDHTPSIIPAAAVPLYTGTSPYLLFTKYNNYAGIGNGDGRNKIAVLDPFATQVDPVSGITVMREVMTIVGPTPDPPNGPGAVREWCINSTAIDVPGHSALVNNEDGKLYRWDFATNTLSQTITLTAGVSEAYTPTIVGPDGAVYAINDGILFAVGQ